MEQNSGKIALLIMDMQKGILKNYPSAQAQITNAMKAIDSARKRNIPVLFVRVGLRPGLPEINPNNKMFSGIRDRIGNENIEEWMQIEPTIAPLENEIIINKKRVSAFAGSDLEIILRYKGIQHLVLGGVATSGVVLSTLREAADKDYRITVLSDCCLDPDEEVHRVLTTKVFVRQAEVQTTEEWRNDQ
jgi:nicotinamidase-related amidase